MSLHQDLSNLFERIQDTPWPGEHRPSMSSCAADGGAAKSWPVASRSP